MAVSDHLETKFYWPPFLHFSRASSHNLDSVYLETVWELILAELFLLVIIRISKTSGHYHYHLETKVTLVRCVILSFDTVYNWGVTI